MKDKKEDIKIWKFKDKWRIVKDRKVIWTCDSEFIFNAIDFFKKNAIENTQETNNNAGKKFVYSSLTEPKDNDKITVSLKEAQKELNKLMNDVMGK